jgi:hypothetical protein
MLALIACASFLPQSWPESNHMSDAALLVVYNGTTPRVVSLRSTNTDTTVVNTVTADEIHAFQ